MILRSLLLALSASVVPIAGVGVVAWAGRPTFAAAIAIAWSMVLATVLIVPRIARNPHGGVGY